MTEGPRVTHDAAGRQRAIYAGTLLCAGAIVGVLAAMWLFDGKGLEESRSGVPGRVVGSEAAGDVPMGAADVDEPVQDVERVVTRVRRAQAQTEGSDSKGQPMAEQKEPEIKAGEYIAALRAAGETGGIAAFNPPGTDPVKSGIIVPDDYELPPGYARRYQTLDDGTDVPPILMFSPDYEFLDSDGKAIPLPDDLIVPPEMAPPDLPVRVLSPKKYAGR
jgi:hypothetical protein